MAFSKFESISVRPPTPPKELRDIQVEEDPETLQFLQDPFGTHKPVAALSSSAAASLNTPDSSPSSELTDPLLSSSRKKRVSFEPKTCMIPAHLTAQPWTPQRSPPLRPLPQSRVSKPLKPILKATDSISTPTSTDEGVAAHKFETFADMLESIVKMLAQGGRSSKIDAYNTLNRTMQAYDKVPDVQAFISKMVLFEQFIRRDMQSIGISGTGPDSQLQSQALKLLMALVRIPELKTVMEDEFCAFIIDRITVVAADRSMPKQVINHHLALLMQQNFRPRTMTVARVEKILEVLDTIHDRVSGFSVQAYRIRVYRKLIQQRKDVMAKHTEGWFKHLLQGMLMNQKDIHGSAMDTAICAARDIGSERIVNKAVLSLLNRVRSDSESDTFGKLFAQKLEKTLLQDSAASVPSVWGIITAFLQNSLEERKFTAIRDWLEVFQSCVSSENEAVRIQANIAFGFLVYAVDISESTSVAWCNMFFSISKHQLERRQAKKAEIDSATSGYLTLLYYALRPTASHVQLDRYWKELVANFWRPQAHKSKKHAAAACRITSTLLNGSRKPWIQQRALELRPHFMIQHGELPVLDPKWVRKAVKSILQFVETLLEATPWTPEELEDEPAKTMWLALLDALVEASSKEVMASTETKDAVAHVVNMLRRMWDSHTAKLALPQREGITWADKYCFLIETVVQRLGAYQFADKFLARNRQDEFEVAATPSNRSRQHSARTSPLLYFIELLVNQSEGRLPDPVRLRVLHLILEPCLAAQKTRHAKLELLRDCAAGVSSASGNVVVSKFWNQIATLTRNCVEEHPADITDRQSRQLGKEYEVVVEILTYGSDHLLNDNRGQDLLEAFINVVKRETNEGGVVLAVVEKVSKSILAAVGNENSNRCLPYTTTLLQHLPRMLTRRTLEQGRQLLYPSSPSLARTSEFDPYNYIYTAIASVGASTYTRMASEDTGYARDFIVALKDFIHASSQSLLTIFLRKTQQAIVCWVEDPERKLEVNDQATKQLYAEVLTLWRTVNEAFEKLPRKDSGTLSTLAPLVTAGFKSHRRGIVNISITTWNTTFGAQDHIKYPLELETTLRRLSKTVELSLPGFLGVGMDEGDLSPYYESDNGTPTTPRSMPFQNHARVKDSPLCLGKSAQKPALQSPTIAGSSKRKKRQRTPKIRLRHENSQVQFEPIISSPSNPFEQQSQVLTERQKEMVERHRLGAKMFAHMGSSSISRQDSGPSRQHNEDRSSDVMSADGLPNEGSPLPMKALASMPAMDVYLGSSPTPSSRSRGHEAKTLTPKTNREAQLAADLSDLGSSPPRLEKGAPSTVESSAENDTARDVDSVDFDPQEIQEADISSFNDGTTIDEDMILSVERKAQLEEKESSDDDLTELDSADMPSSTMEFELNAQLDAEMNAHVEPLQEKDAQVEPEVLEESNNVYVDAPSQRPLDAIEGSEVGETQLDMPQEPVFHATRSAGTSRVRDSFSTPTITEKKQTTLDSQTSNLRRSSRHSAVSDSGTSTGSRKRKQPSQNAPSPKKPKITDKNAEEPTPEPRKAPLNKQEQVRDSVVNSPADKPSPRRRGRPSKASVAESPVIPETSRKRSVRRSASLLSQGQLQSDDVLVEDTPAPKRARRSASKDVSEAKGVPLADSRASQVKRLSHVQVSPKPLPASRESSAGAAEQVIDLGEPAIDTVQGSALGEQNANGTLQQHGNTAEPIKREQTPLQPATAAVATPNRSFADRVFLTPRSILAQLGRLKDELKKIVLGPAEEREFADVGFEINREIFAAGARGRHEAQ